MLVKNWTEQSDRESGYLWLWRLRWCAALALVCGACAAAGLLQVRLPVMVLCGVVALLLLTNGWAHPSRSLVREHCHHFIAAWLMLDVVLLTIVLYFTGGAHNPLTMLYLLYVALAVILLPAAGAWFIAALTVGAFALLFESPHMLVAQGGRHLCSDMDFHLKGMVFGLGMAGAGVVYFISSLNRALAAKHRELEQIREQMQAQRTLVEMSAVAATVAHELATPLGTIAVIGDDLKSITCENGCREQLREDARLIDESIQRCRRALELVGQVGARPPADQSKTIHADGFFKRLSLYLTKEEWTRLVIPEAAGGAGAVSAPLRQLVIMVSILVRNALDASRPGAAIQLHWRADSSTVTIEVEDEGTGMETAVRERADEPFFTTKAPGEGIGLGLYLVRLFAERHKGHLSIDSATGQGSRVGLHLPRHNGKDSRA
jgi:two-component system sensor histidine kinase RegB